MSLKVKEFSFYKLSPEEKIKVLEKLRKLMEQHEEVLLVVVYGSFLKNYPFRDIDVAVYVVGEVDPLDYKLKLDSELSDEISYPVDSKVLNEAPPWFVRKVLREGEVLLEKAPLIVEKLYLKALDEGADHS